MGLYRRKFNSTHQLKLINANSLVNILTFYVGKKPTHELVALIDRRARGITADVVLHLGGLCGDSCGVGVKEGINMKNSISFRLSGRYALFTDPITKIGGEKCSYHIPTYEALKGVCKSIYWKPTLIWVIDRVRVMKPIRTQTKGTKPLVWTGGNSLAIYTFLRDVEYQVQAHFIWNEYRPELEADRNDGKHFAIARRMVEKGGRQDIFLGTRDCQGYVESCEFGEGGGAYDDLDELGFGLMFHGFDYPDETGEGALHSRFWRSSMKYGIVEFPVPNECECRQFIREMEGKKFEVDRNLKNAIQEEVEL